MRSFLPVFSPACGSTCVGREVRPPHGNDDPERASTKSAESDKLGVTERRWRQRLSVSSRCRAATASRRFGRLPPMAPFELTEYARAEARFIYAAIDALSRARGGIVAEIKREPASRVGTTQVTLDDGVTVELEAAEVGAPIKLADEDVIAFRVEPLLASIDEAAEHHHAQLTKYFFASLDTITAATGNQVDAAGKSYFEYMSEMYETIDMTFDDDGNISSSFVMVADPETAERMKQREAEMTADERRRLNELLEHKREEYFARRRRRKLS